MTHFKYVPKVKTRSGKFFQTGAKDLLKFILANKCGYEIKDGYCIPHYDFDKAFDTADEQKRHGSLI